MEIPTIIEIDCSTGEETRRLMTEEEFSKHQQAMLEMEQLRISYEQEEANKLIAKESAMSKLSALGLTEEEVQAIVG